MKKKNIIDQISILMLGGEDELVKQKVSELTDLNLPGRDGRTLLMHCCIYDKKELMRWLLGKDVEVNKQDSMGMTALHYAVEKHDREAVKLLLENGASVKLKDAYGNNPMLKAGAQDLELIKLLLHSGCSPYEQNDYGISPAFILQSVPEIAALFDKGEK